MRRRGWILREGYPFIAPPLGIGLFAFAVGWPALGAVGISSALAAALFFRNPDRSPPNCRGAVLAPADGRILEVARLEPREGATGPTLKVSIFMSVFNVHVNRSPVHGRVLEVRHEPGTFRPAHRAETSRQNERNALRIRTEDGRIVSCVQVAGVLARRIVCWIREGTSLRMGEPFGLICFGSRVDCYLPQDFEPAVTVGQRVRGGETILGHLPSAAEDSPA